MSKLWRVHGTGRAKGFKGRADTVRVHLPKWLERIKVDELLGGPGLPQRQIDFADFPRHTVHSSLPSKRQTTLREPENVKLLSSRLTSGIPQTTGLALPFLPSEANSGQLLGPCSCPNHRWAPSQNARPELKVPGVRAGVWPGCLGAAQFWNHPVQIQN
ncbi:hypothetical protein KIL84_019344 [Mauremys mutica]|uniref:Uncharacterized protein n=1 Tax=Mauremys mutica TaxID=74926 RepID=A0A9D3XWS6_9SAUR|nr:hypothetical protein KIL84_019344 [Mauremys mutica]